MMTKRIGIFAGTALAAFLSMTDAGRADTISYADAVTTLAKECGSDIKKFCNGQNLGNGRIQACLGKSASKVSPNCTSTLGGVLASIAKRQWPIDPGHPESADNMRIQLINLGLLK
ncbi:cysteine rich repeat-containing protein [Rhizobium leguminosarum]|uniref:cysteine rich repeat-containing protein n=1 Tax=Rhizobium leguminosarum TaxID=384 RepID=UPI000E2A17B1|nr:cysteine rich repeat-containing protein [Rhizobium leguminosarum]